MKAYHIYVCEECGKESCNKDDILQCEAEHLGLSVEEKCEYDHLNNLVERWSHTVNRTCNRDTRSALDSYVTKLLAFEVEHNMNDSLNKEANDKHARMQIM